MTIITVARACREGYLVVVRDLFLDFFTDPHDGLDKRQKVEWSLEILLFQFDCDPNSEEDGQTVQENCHEEKNALDPHASWYLG